MPQSNRQRYEEFLIKFRNMESRANLHPDDLIQIAAFCLAKARTKQIVNAALGPKDERFFRECEAMLMRKSGTMLDEPKFGEN